MQVSKVTPVCNLQTHQHAANFKNCALEAPDVVIRYPEIPQSPVSHLIQSLLAQGGEKQSVP